jgi:hypothetical protein
MLTLTVAIACGLRSAPLRPFAERVTAAAGWLLIALGTVLTLRLV